MTDSVDAIENGIFLKNMSISKKDYVYFTLPIFIKSRHNYNVTLSK